MKKIVLISLILLLVSGCGKETTSFNPNDLANELLTEVDFDDELTLFAGDISKIYDMPEVEDYLIYIGSGATSEEIAIITLKNSSDEEDVKASLEKRVEEQKQNFANYVPEEVSRLEKSIIKSNEKYVVLCVSSDNQAEKIIDKYL